MKKQIILYAILAATYIANAQELSTTDGLRYAQDQIEGSARFRGMSGAFGALGGDLSAININPAGSAIFNSSEMGISLGVNNKNNTTNYFNGVTSNNDTNTDLSQFGAAFVFKNRNENSPWKKFTLSIAYDRSANLDQEWNVAGTNPNTSIASYFLSYANGESIENISAIDGETISQAYQNIGIDLGFGNQQGYLGFEGFIFDETDIDGVYESNINGNNFNQRFSNFSRGFNSKVAFNFATNYNNRFYLGVNLNAHAINYERNTIFNETNSNASSSINRVGFNNNLLTTGSGFSFQIGGIAKVTEAFRVGLTYNSPTWFRISEETSQSLTTSGVDEVTNLPARAIVNPNVINIYPAYTLQTPSKVTGSLAYVFGTKGLLSFDYEVKNYGNIRFKPTSDIVFASINADTNALLTTAATARVGGEYRIKRFSLRGGYRYEQSPYTNEAIIGDLNSFSLGLGYSFGSTTLDLAYSHAQRDIDNQLFSVGLTDAARINTKFTDVV